MQFLGDCWQRAADPEQTKVASVADAISDLSVQTSLEALLQDERTRARRLVRLFNPTGKGVSRSSRWLRERGRVTAA